jgi:chromosomal replication initiator protein
MVDTVWGKVQDALRADIAGKDFETWIEPLLALDWEADRLTLGASSPLARDWIKGHLGEALEQALRGVTSPTATFQLVVRGTAPPRAARTVPPSTLGTGARARETLPLGLRRYTFGSFVGGSSHAVAMQAAREVVENHDGRFSPLFLYGEVGLGKTHLLAAIAQGLVATKRSTVRYLTAETFVNELIVAIRRERTEAFRRRFRGVGTLIVDDVQFLAGKRRSQEEFAHTFNALHELGNQIVLASDREPDALPGMEVALRNRLSSGMMAQIEAPDGELRAALVERKLAGRGLIVEEGVVDLLREQWWENVRELEGLITRIEAFAAATGGPITRVVVADSLGRCARKPPQRATMDRVMHEVCQEFSVTREELLSRRRTARLTLPRHVAMYLCRYHTDRPLAAIGAALGGRDHSTVVHGVSAIERRLGRDDGLLASVRQLQRRIKG